MPAELRSLALTALTPSRTGLCALGALTVKPAICSMVKSVLPPALVLRWRPAGSG